MKNRITPLLIVSLCIHLNVFSQYTAPTGKPVITSHSNEDIVNSTDPIFSWEGGNLGNHPDAEYVMVIDEQTWETKIGKNSVLNLGHKVYIKNGDYTIKIRAWSPEGCGEWSDRINFNVEVYSLSDVVAKADNHYIKKGSFVTLRYVSHTGGSCNTVYEYKWEKINSEVVQDWSSMKDITL